jgi:uncharacterized membrane protein YqjE
MESKQINSPPGEPAPSLLLGLTGIAKNAVGLLFSRVELAALELAEVRTTLLKLALVFALGIVAAWFALAYWSALVVALTWESLGWKILLIIALVFTFATLGMFLYVRAMLKQGKLSLPATMSELRQDRDALL